MFREPIDPRGGVSEKPPLPEGVAECAAKIDAAEAQYDTTFSKIRENPALATLVRGALGLTTALAVGLYEREAVAAPTADKVVKLSFTTFDPRAQAKQEAFERDARSARTRALSRNLETRHEHGLRLISSSDTNEPQSAVAVDYEKLFNGRAVFFDELMTSFKGWDSRKIDDKNAATDPLSTRGRIQQRIYAIDAGAVPEPITDTVITKSYAAPSRNDAVRAALQQAAYLTQRGLGLNLIGESQYIRVPGERTARPLTISLQAYNVSHTRTALVLTNLHIGVKELTEDGKKVFVAAVSARGALLGQHNRTIAQK